jgi:hypothetical protein
MLQIIRASEEKKFKQFKYNIEKERVLPEFGRISSP